MSDSDNWPFDPTPDTAALTTRQSHLLELDNSLGSIADLPPGWSAWRDAGNDEWARTEEDPEEY
jgi:hypothetical protein